MANGSHQLWKVSALQRGGADVILVKVGPRQTQEVLGPLVAVSRLEDNKLLIQRRGLPSLSVDLFTGGVAELA